MGGGGGGGRAGAGGGISILWEDSITYYTP